MTEDPKQRYTMDDIVIIRYGDDTPQLVRQLCKSWTSGLTMEDDNEPGADAYGTWDWVAGNTEVCNYLNDGPEDPRGIYYVFQPTNPGIGGLGVIVGQFGMPHDDRRSARNAGLDDTFTVWGGIVVDREHRGRGLFSLIINYMDQLMQAESNRRGKPVVAYLTTDEPDATRGYERIGFVVLNMEVHNEFFDEQLYRKEYTPAAA